MSRCTLEISAHVVVEAQEGPLSAEYALFEPGDIELQSSEPGTNREAGYRTTAGRARARLAEQGITATLAAEAAEALRPISASYARGAAVQCIVDRLGAAEFFEGQLLDTGTGLYRGAWLDLPALSADLGLMGGPFLLQAIHLAALLAERTDDEPVALQTSELTAQRRPGERTFRRVTFECIHDLVPALRSLGPGSPRPRTSSGPSRQQVVERLPRASRAGSGVARDPSQPRGRADRARDADARASRRSGALGARGAPLARRDAGRRRRARRDGGGGAAGCPRHRVPSRARGSLAAPGEAARARRAGGRAVDVDANVPRTRAPRRPGLGRRGRGAARSRVRTRPARQRHRAGGHTPPVAPHPRRPRRKDERHARAPQRRRGERRGQHSPGPRPPTGIGADGSLESVGRTRARASVEPAPAAVLFANRTTDKAPPRRSTPVPASSPRTGEAERIETLSLPAGLQGMPPPSLDEPPRAPPAARLAFTFLTRELGRELRMRHGVELSTDLEGLEVAQRYLRERLTDGRVRTRDDERELMRNGAFLSELLARRLGAFWVDLDSTDSARWTMLIPAGDARGEAAVDYPPEPTRVWPFARVLRFVAMGHKERPRELLSGARSLRSAVLMPIILKPENVLDVGADRVVDETSDESFDRAAFARRAIDLVKPRRTTIAICEGAARLRVESGRVWGRPRARTEASGRPDAADAGELDERWALLAIPAQASRRAIAIAVAQLARGTRAYALDVLMGEASAAGETAAREASIEPSAA